jgi:hypothetical protein
MRSEDLTREQFNALRRYMLAIVDDLARLEKRMYQKGFQSSDPIFFRVKELRQAADELAGKCAYLEITAK